VHKFDVSRPDELPALVELVSSLVQPGWRVNLVNNAAILPKTYSEANFRAVISTNVLYDRVHMADGGVEQALIKYALAFSRLLRAVTRALVRLVAAFVPVLQRAEGGVIINMTSQMGKRGGIRRHANVSRSLTNTDLPALLFVRPAGNLARVPGRYRDYVLNADSKHWTLDSLVSGKDSVPLYEKEIADGYNMYVVSKGLVDRITELQAEVRLGKVLAP